MRKGWNRILAAGTLALLLWGGFALLERSRSDEVNPFFVPARQGWVMASADGSAVPAQFGHAVESKNGQFAIERRAGFSMMYYEGIGVFTVQQNVRVLVNDEPVYDSMRDRRGPIGYGSGRVWHYVRLPRLAFDDVVRIEYRGSRVTLAEQLGWCMDTVNPREGCTYPIPSDEGGFLGDIYFGDPYDYGAHIIRGNLLPLLLALGVVMLGFATVAFAHHANRVIRERSMDFLMYFGVGVLFAGTYLLASNAMVNAYLSDVYIGFEIANISTLLSCLSIGIALAVSCKRKWRLLSRIAIGWSGFLLILRIVGYFVPEAALIALQLGTEIYLYLLLFLLGAADLRMLYRLSRQDADVALQRGTATPGLHRQRIDFSEEAFYFGVATPSDRVPLRRRELFMVVSWAMVASIDIVAHWVYGVDSIYFRALSLLLYFALYLGLEVNIYLKVIELASQKEHYKVLAEQDRETGLDNRMALRSRLALYNGKLSACSAVALDVDELKKVNDRLGHVMGDTLITTCARMLREHFGDVGTCYRMGGDEFLVLAVNQSAPVMRERMARLRAAMRKERIWCMDDLEAMFDEGEPPIWSIQPSMSMGLAVYERGDANIEELMRRADHAMYEDKRREKLRRAEQNEMLFEVRPL